MPEQSLTYVCLGAWLWEQAQLGFVLLWVARQQAPGQSAEGGPQGKEAAGARTGNVRSLGLFSDLDASDI